MTVKYKPAVTLIIAATVPNMGIGLNGKLPWRLAREMKYFKQVTTGSTVVMGRKTWDSIPAKFRPLPDRQNIVVSTCPDLDLPQGVRHALSYESAIDQALELDQPVYVIGGAQLYESALKHELTTQVLLTEIRQFEGECDAFFDSFPWTDDEAKMGEWKRSEFKRLQEVTSNAATEGLVDEKGVKYTFSLWER